jgi:tetratricopeptide (TPR) repeat protein
LSLAGDNERLRLATTMYMARARQARGEFRSAIELFEQILAMLERKPSDDFHGLPVLPAAFSRSGLAICLAVSGDFAKAEAYAAEAARRADAVGQPDSIMWAYWSIGSVALNKGDCAAAVLVFDRLLDVCTTHDLDAYASRIMAGLGRTMARVGQVREGLALLEKAVALDEIAEPQLTRSLTLIAFAEALVLAGEFDRALATVTDLLQRTRSLGERAAEAHVCWLGATIHAARADDPEAGMDMIETATTLAGELDLLPLLAHCHLTRAHLYRRRGQQAEADAYSERGGQLIEQLGMKPWFTPPQ